MLTDQDIVAMTPVQRRALIRKLGRVTPAPGGPRFRLLRAVRFLMVAGALFLVPWTIYLACTLPARYVVENWTTVWVGFDVLLVAMFATTAGLAWRRHPATALTAFATGVLLLADAWFDVVTAQSGDVWSSITTAALLEAPTALTLITAAVHRLQPRPVADEPAPA
jgi:hypothetical protein